MALSQADLDSLDTAIAAGQLEVQFGERRIRYRSVEELLAARSHVAQVVAANSAPEPRSANRRFVFATSRGE